MLDTTAPSVKRLLRRARAAFESRLPAAGRDRAPLARLKAGTRHHRPLRRGDATADIDGVVALLTDERG